MVPERATVTIRSDLGEDGPLTVSDALRQVLDYFDLLTLAQGDDAGNVNWRLVTITKSSPLTATAEAYAVVPGADVSTVARQAKRAVYAAVSEISSGRSVPPWMDSEARQKLKNIFLRNTNGIGRTDFKVDEETPVIMLVTKSANTGLATLNKAEAALAANEADFSRVEIGSVEGHVAEATTYRKQPALTIRDRLSNAEIICVFSDELASRTADHRWREVWDGARVLVHGRISYNRKGIPSTIAADDIIELTPRSLSYEDISDTHFTGGLGPVEYLEQEREIG